MTAVPLVDRARDVEPAWPAPGPRHGRTLCYATTDQAFEQNAVTCRRAHECSECGSAIQPGDRALRWAGLDPWHGFTHGHLCTRCPWPPLRLVRRRGRGGLSQSRTGRRRSYEGRSLR